MTHRNYYRRFFLFLCILHEHELGKMKNLSLFQPNFVFLLIHRELTTNQSEDFINPFPITACYVIQEMTEHLPPRVKLQLV